MTHDPSTRRAARALFGLGAKAGEVAKLLQVPISTAESWKSRWFGRKPKTGEVRHG